MNIGIIGSRRRDEAEDHAALSCAVAGVIGRYAGHGIKFTIISGGCPKGGDRFAEIIAKDQGLEKIIYYPDWSTGRHAGFVRNTTIAQKSHILIACVAKDRKGGTEDTIKKFLKKLSMDEKMATMAGWLILV